MQRTAPELMIRVGEDKTPLRLTDGAVQAVQDEAAGKLISALSGAWAIQKTIGSAEGFADLDLNQLIDLRDHLHDAVQLVEVLIDCRPLDELADDDE